MKFKLKNSSCDIDIPRDIAAFISKFHAIQQDYEAATRDVNEAFKKHAFENKDFTHEALIKAHEETIKSNNAEYKARCAQINGNLYKYISDIKSKLTGELSVSNNSADYSMRFNNALVFLQAEGSEITDEIASDIFSEFKNDMPLMRRVRRMIELQKGEKISDGYGNTTFSKTLGALDRYEKYCAEFDGIGEIASKIFMTECVDGELDEFKGHMLSVPMLSYPELIYESQLAEGADVLQKMTSELFESA